MIARPENPMKLRGKREPFPPTRAILAEKDGRKDTATWAFKGTWFCLSASRGLKWMRRMTLAANPKQCLLDQRFDWHWIQPETINPIAPPF